MKDYFELGRVIRAHGTRGEIKTLLYTDNLDRIRDLDHVLVGEPPELKEYKVIRTRTDGKFAFLELEGITDRTEAETLREETLYIDRASAAKLPEGAYYISDLLELPVSTDEGTALGTLKDILQHGAADVYVVDRGDGRELMFPAADGVFVERNPEEGRIVLNSKRLAEVAEL